MPASTMPTPFAKGNPLTYDFHTAPADTSPRFSMGPVGEDLHFGDATVVLELAFDGVNFHPEPKVSLDDANRIASFNFEGPASARLRIVGPMDGATSVRVQVNRVE